MMPTFHLTRIAIEAFDAHDATEPPTRSSELQAWWDVHDALLRRVGESFALDTADRNDPAVAARVVDDLAFVRRCLAMSSRAFRPSDQRCA